MNLILKMWVLWLMMLSTRPRVVTAPPTTSDAKPGCAERCGNVSVPYPFGIDYSDCAKDDRFVLNCNYSNTPAELWFANIPVVNISLQEGTTTVRIHTAYVCYDESGRLSKQFNQSVNLENSPFTFSDSKNKLTSLGCDTFALMGDSVADKFFSGCVSYCVEHMNIAEEGFCSGIGCCQISIPKGLKKLNISISSPSNRIEISKSNPCGYAFLVEESSFSFSKMKLSVSPHDFGDSQVVLDWVIGNETCEKAQAQGGVDQSAYACGPNTNCVDSASGYRCLCREGFQGNPYLPQGCQDIDECKQPQKYPCEGACKNTAGSYTCRCPLGMHRDGKAGCQAFGVTRIAIVVGASISFAIIVLFTFIQFKKRKKEKNFKENGGFLLKQVRVRIFSEAELAKATNNYNVNQLLGQGSSGSVYRGILANNIQVAIKKPKEVDRTQINRQFQHEIGIVSQVNHKNVVKLLGLCLETKIPLLVYEFVPNGSLFEHIHKRNSEVFKLWRNRLKITAETALALDYLHCLAEPPIIHGNIKSMNILLDETYTAKVSDFGASVLIPPAQTRIMDTKIGETGGYLDPEYLVTGELTVKSDVYSFGVVLMELLTGEKQIIRVSTSGEKRNVIRHFVSSIENKQLFQILNVEVRDDDERKQIEEVAELAKRCLKYNAEERPTMKEVADILTGLRDFNENLRSRHNKQETVGLLDESLHHFP